jgi:hypothetical protein
MKLQYTLILGLVLAVRQGVESAPPEVVLPKGQTVVVTANRVNVRATPKETGELVGQVDFDDRLVAKSFLGEWVEIVPPAGISFYVHGDFLKDNQVTVPILHVRSGPSVNYSIVGQLVRNQHVLPRGVFNEWIEIEPPKNASVWVHNKFLKLEQAQPASPAAPALPEGEPEKKGPVKKPETAKPAPPLAPSQPVKVEKSSTRKIVPPYDLDLIPLEGQGKLVKRQGYLKLKASVFGVKKPSKYRLEVPYKNKSDLVCYIKEEGPDLKDYVDQWVIIQGHEFWVQGEGRPVIVPKAVVIAERPAHY